MKISYIIHLVNNEMRELGLGSEEVKLSNTLNRACNNFNSVSNISKIVKCDKIDRDFVHNLFSKR
jgi:hypothetical protein